MKTADRDAERVWQIVVEMVMASRGNWRRQASELTGLPFSRVRALRRLQDQESTLRELAHEMSVDAPAATVIINDLEARGLVTRRPHPENGRAKLVSLTAEGRQRVAALSQISDEPPAALAALAASDLAQLRRIFEQLGAAG